MPAAATTRGGTKRPNPRDFTGVQKARLEEEHAEELEARAEEVALVTKASARRKAEVVDYTKGGHSGPGLAQPSMVGTEISDELAAELQETEVEVAPVEVTIRVNSKIEDMVFGRTVEPAVFDEDGKLLKHAVDHGLQFYSFEEGTPYKVPVELAKHLDRIGYLYH